MFIDIAKVEGVVTCFHNPDHKYNYHQWSSFFCPNEKSLQMRQALMASHQYIKENQVEFLVVDLENCEDAFSEDDQQWINEYAIPTEKEIGIRYFVTIVASNLYSELSMKDWQEQTQGFMTFINVKTLEEAEKWIQSKQLIAH